MTGVLPPLGYFPAHLRGTSENRRRVFVKRAAISMFGSGRCEVIPPIPGLRGQRRSGAQVRGKQGGQSIDDRGPTPPTVIYGEPLPLFDSNRGADPSARDIYGLWGPPALRGPCRACAAGCLAQGKVILAVSTFRR